MSKEHIENGKNLIHSFNQTESSDGYYKGLTKREYIAIKVLSAFAESHVDKDTISRHCMFARDYADKLLEILKH
jgi:hypothetical protein